MDENAQQRVEERRKTCVGQKFRMDEMEDLRVQDIAYWQSRPPYERIMAGWEHSVMLYAVKETVFQPQVDDTDFL